MAGHPGRGSGKVSRAGDDGQRVGCHMEITAGGPQALMAQEQLEASHIHPASNK